MFLDDVFILWLESVFGKLIKGSVSPDFIIILTLFSGISILLRLLI